MDKCLLNKRVRPAPLESLSMGTAAKLCGSISSSLLNGNHLIHLACVDLKSEYSENKGESAGSDI